MCLYFQNRKKKEVEEDENMTPYEKWMRNEEIKNQGTAAYGDGQVVDQNNPMHAAAPPARRPSMGDRQVALPPARRGSRGPPMPPAQDGYDQGGYDQGGYDQGGFDQGYPEYPEPQEPESVHNPVGYYSGGKELSRRPSRGGPSYGYDDGQLDQPAPGYDDYQGDQYAEQAFDDDFSQDPSMARGGPGAGPGPYASPQSRGGPPAAAGGTMRRPSAARNPLRQGGPAGRRGSAMMGGSGGRPTSDAAAAFMARKKRQSTR